MNVRAQNAFAVQRVKQPEPGSAFAQGLWGRHADEARSRRELWLLACAVLVLSTLCVQAQEVVQTLAGAVSTNGTANGAVKDARFNDPAGLVMDQGGNLYVADNQNHVIRKITPTGVVSTLAGNPGVPGSANGSGTNALFDSPSGIALDAGGNLYVTDTGNHTLRKISSGAVITIAGLAGTSGSTNGTGSDARFNSPLGVAADKNGVVYVADSGNHVIRKVTASGVVTTLAGEAEVWGSNDGPGNAAHFNGPVGLAVDDQGNLYVADANNHTIRKVTAAGTVTTLAGLAGADGCVDGPGAAARFCQPAELVLGQNGILYVADSLNHVIRRVAPDGTTSTLAGLPGHDGSADGTSSQARFFNPYGLAIDPGGNLYISDTYNQTVRLLLVPFRVQLADAGDATRRQIIWDAVVGRKYRVQYKDQISGGSWSDLGDVVALSATASLDDTLPVPTTQRFYRVVLVE